MNTYTTYIDNQLIINLNITYPQTDTSVGVVVHLM